MFTTSQEAYTAIQPTLTRLQRQVYTAIKVRGSRGATDEEVQSILNMNPSTQRPRRIELAEQKLIRKSNTRRQTRSGRNANVWIAA